MSILDKIFVEKTPERKYKYINLNEGIKEIKRSGGAISIDHRHTRIK